MFGEAPAPRPGTSHPRRPSLAQPPTPLLPATPGRESFRGSLERGGGAPHPSSAAGDLGVRGPGRRSGFGPKGRGGSRTRWLSPPRPALHFCPAAALAAAPSPPRVLSPERPSGPGVREESHINLP